MSTPDVNERLTIRKFRLPVFSGFYFDALARVTARTRKRAGLMTRINGNIGAPGSSAAL
jgi:hypothetical protein